MSPSFASGPSTGGSRPKPTVKTASPTSVLSLGIRLPGKRPISGTVAMHMPHSPVVPQILQARFPLGLPPGPRLNWHEIPRRYRHSITTPYR